MKRALFITLVLISLMLVASHAFGIFVRHETEKVPIDRLLTNLHQRLAKNTNDVELAYQLARVYSMAYATNLTEVNVAKEDGAPVFGYPGSASGVPRHVQTFKTSQSRQAALNHLTNAIVLYERTLLLLKKSPNPDDRWYVLPAQLGLAWCLDQNGHRDLALNAYRKALKVAWKIEVTGDFDFKEWAKDVWDDIRAGQNPIRSRQRGYLGPGVCYSEEVIGYMLAILDPEKDAKEIASIKERQKRLDSMSRAITPVLVPLESEASFSDLVNSNANIAFDLDGSGILRRWGWVTPKAAWLVFDSNGDGKITSALQMFGNVTFWIFWQDGYAALASLDDDGDGALRGLELSNLALWQDRDGNGFSDSGEVLPLQAAGIIAISCRSQTFSSEMKWNPNGVTFTDGKVRPTYDWIVPSN